MNCRSLAVLALVGASLIGCGMPTPKDKTYPVTLIIENRTALPITVGHGYPDEPISVASGATVQFDTAVPGGMIRESVSFAFPSLVAFALPRSMGGSMYYADDWATADTVRFRGNVSGIHEAPVTPAIKSALSSYDSRTMAAAFADAGGTYTVREGRLYYFAPTQDTAIFMARQKEIGPEIGPDEAFVEDGVTWWRMTKTSVVGQSIEVKRDGPETIHVTCEATGCR